MPTSSPPRAAAANQPLPSLPRHLLHLEQEWRFLADSYAGLTEDEMLQAGTIGSWSVKDTLAHISLWDHQALLHLPTITKGLRLPRYASQGGIDAFNARAFNTRHHLPLALILSQLNTTHASLLAYLLATPLTLVASKTRFLRRLRLDTYSHYRLHADNIRAWRANRPA